MEEIESNLHSLHNIFVNLNHSLYIPVFQREFVWDEEIIEQLINDFRDDSNDFSIDSSQLPGYLLGNIVLINSNSARPYYSVVDGQQRLISLTLLAKALNERLLIKVSETHSDMEEMTNWIEYKSDLRKFFSIITDDGVRTDYRITFNEYLNYGDFYLRLLSDDIDNTETSDLTVAESNILEVYTKLEEIISDFTDEQLKKFVNYFKSNIKLIVTIAPSEERAFQLFEVLNSRGRVLEPLDLIKNIFLQRIYEDNCSEQEKRDFNKNWSDFSENLVVSKNRVISASTFLKHYIIGKYGLNKKKDQLYSFIKEKELTSAQIIQLAKELKKVSLIYKNIEKKNFQSFVDSTEGSIDDSQKQTLEVKVSILFKILGVNQFHSLIIPFYFDSFDKKNLLLDKAIKYGTAVLFAQRQTNVIESDLENFLSRYIADSDEANRFTNMMHSIEQETLNYIQEFQNNLHMVNYGKRRKKITNLLKLIEVYGNKNYDVLHAPKTGPNSITLEHIMPKTPENDIIENNFNDINEYNFYKDCIGNLTLLKLSPNSGGNNDPFSEKKDDYKASPYYITSNIIGPAQNNRRSGQQFEDLNHINRWNLQYTSLKNEDGEELEINDHWTKEAIIVRGKRMTEYITNILQ